MGSSTTTKTYYIAAGYAAVFASALWLLFYNLDSHLLWGDEAETAVLAKNVLQFGVPRTFDGTNYLILHGTMDETPDHIWIWSPWLQEYLAASSFMFFGQTTWAARAPFALVGWICLMALALAAYKIYQRHWVVFACVIMLGTSEVFLLHARQSRYYSISVLGEILLIYGMYQLLARNRLGVWVSAFALILQFYSNYIIVVGNFPALLILAWMMRKQGKAGLLRVLAVFGIFLAAILPWLIYAHPWKQTKAVGEENYFAKLCGYLSEFHFHFMPLCFLLLPLLGWIWNRKKGGQIIEPDVLRQWEKLLLLLLPSYLIAILAAPGFYLRYLLPILPVVCLLAAAWVFRYVKWRALAIALVAIQSVSNLFSFCTAPFQQTHPLQFPLLKFAQGITASYTDRFADVLDFFKTHTKPGERVMTYDPEYPLVFYTPLGVINGRLMGPPAGQLPDWVLPFPASGVVDQPLVPLPEFLKPRYEMIVLQVHNSNLGASVSEPDCYQYHSADELAPFVIYKLKTQTNSFVPAQ